MVKGSCKLCLFPKSLRGVAQFGVYNKGGNEMQDPCPFRLTMAHVILVLQMFFLLALVHIILVLENSTENLSK